MIRTPLYTRMTPVTWWDYPVWALSAATIGLLAATYRSSGSAARTRLAALWLTGRWNGVVYALSTNNGRLLAKIPVGAGPHGLAVWPQPGRFSLGHTGVMR